MPKTLYIPVIETEKEIKSLLKKHSGTFLAFRLRMLLAMKQADEKGITKIELMGITGCCSQSIQTWRTAYKTGGLHGLLSHKMTGYKPSSFSEEEINKLKELMNDPHNNIKGYKELNTWVKNKFNKEIKYNTLLKFMIAKFNTSLKVARKSHIKKDEKAVEDFKKTSNKTVKMK